MACNFYNISISLNDLADATGNSNSSLDFVVFAEYFDCNNVIQTLPFYSDGDYFDVICVDELSNVVLFYNKNNVITNTTFSTVNMSGPCLPTPPCNYYDITIDSIDIASATGNTNPSQNGIVFVAYFDCTNTTQDDPFYTSGVFTNAICASDSFSVPYLYYYENDELTLAPNSTTKIQGSCSVEATPTPTPTTTVTPTLTQTPTPTITSTPTPTTVNSCGTFVLNFDDVSQIYTYDYDTNVTTDRTSSIPSFTKILGVANTNNRLWASQNNSSTTISEWSLTFSPFSTTYIRDINFPTIIPSVIDAIDNTKLICVYNNNVYEADITTTTAAESFKFSLLGVLSTASYITDIVLTTSGKLFVIGYGGFGFNNTLQQYDYITGVLETEVTYTLSFDAISTIAQFGSNLYLLTNNSNVYQVQLTSPYTLTLIKTDDIGFGGSSQSPGCLTQSLVVGPEPTPTPTSTTTPTPTETPTQTPTLTNTSTPTNTQTPTPTITQTPAVLCPTFGSASNFAVLASSTITNTGSSVITGDLGLYPGTSVTGFPPGVVNGTQHITDTDANNAQIDANNSFVSLNALTPTGSVGADIGGLTLRPGVYSVGSSLGITGTVTLDGQGDSNAIFVFQIPSTFIPATYSTISLINGAQPCNVYWVVGSSATLSVGSTNVGNIIALASITINTSASLIGRAFALTAAVTMDTNSITACTCTTNPLDITPTPTQTNTQTSTPTQTPTQTNTQTPTNTPTNTQTPTHTPTQTPTSGYIVQLQSCTDSLDVFRFVNLPSTLILGETYLISDNSFNGCATVITYNGSGPIYDGNGSTMTQVSSGCGDILCPIVGSVPALLASCSDGEVLYANVQQDTAFVGATYYYQGACYSFVEFSGAGGPDLGEPDFRDCIYCVPSPTPTGTPQPTPTITPTPSTTPLPCSNSVYCFSTTLSTLSGYTGNYTVSGNYNNKQYYSGDSITTSFIYYTGSYWCLSNSLGGSCLLQGATPCKSVCPDISANDFTIGMCPSPTPLPIDCTTFDFNAYFDCDWEPIPTPTPSIPCGDVGFDLTSIGVTPTPSPSGDFCTNTAVLFSLSGYTPIVPTVTVTPSVTLTNTVAAGGQVTFNMLEQVFSCVSVKVLKICGTNTEIYTNNNLIYLGIPITSGTTFLASITYPNNENVQTCVTYVRDDSNFSSDSTVSTIYNVYSKCDSCSILTTPTPTPTNTSTPTMTPTSTMTQTPTNTRTQTPTPTVTRTPAETPPPTPTPTQTQTPTNTQTPTKTPTQTPTQTKTPTPTPIYKYVYQSCKPVTSQTTQLTQIIQPVPLSFTVIVGQVFKDSTGVCWEYLGRFDNYTPTTSVITSTQSSNYFVGASTVIYENCSKCNTPLVTCISSLTFIVEYNALSLNGSPCAGSHTCNTAVFDIRANGVNIGQVNLNNVGGPYDTNLTGPSSRRPPNYPNYPGANAYDRYASIVLTAAQAQLISAASTNGLINFSFECACQNGVNCSANTCHTGVGWVRIVKNSGQPTQQILYSACPTGNMLQNFNPCQTT